MSNERNLISDQVITNRAPVRNQDNKHAKKASDGTMSFMVWSITGTALAACSGPIFGDGTSIGGGGGRSGGNGGIPAPENGASALIGDTQFGSVPEAGGVYIRPEVQNEAGDVQAAEIMFRRGALPDGTGDARLSEASTADQLGAPDTPTGADAPADFMATQTVGSAIFYFVSFANLERLVLDPDNNYEGTERNFQIRFLAYDGVDGTFTSDIAMATLADARTLNVVFEAVDDPATGIELVGGVQTETSIDEDGSIDRTKIADLTFTDADRGSPGQLEIVATDGSLSPADAAAIVDMFELGDDDTAIYLKEGTSLDHETLDTLNVRVQRVNDPDTATDETTIGVNISVAVANVEPGGFGVEVDDPATGIALASSPTPMQSVPEDPDNVNPGRTTRIDIATLELTGDLDGGDSGTLEIAELVGTHHMMFDLDGNVLYIKADARLDYETLTTLNVRVQLQEDTSVFLDVPVTVTDVVEGIPIMEDGDNAPIETSRFGTVPADGGIYIQAEVENEDGTAQGATIMFREGLLPNNTPGVTLATRLAGTGLGTLASEPADFMNTVDVEGKTFYFVTQANLVRLLLNPNEDHDVSGAFQIRYLVYDGAADTYTDVIDPATLASASTVPVAFEAVDDPVTAITIDGTQDLTTIAETVGSAVTTLMKVADINFADDDETPSTAVELAGTHAALFMLDVDGTVLNLRADQRIDFEALTTGDEKLEVRVQRVDDPETTTVDESTTIGVNIEVMVTDEVEVNAEPSLILLLDRTDTIANDGTGTAATATLTFIDIESDRADLAIRGAAMGGTTEPTAPAYADAGADLMFDSTDADATVAGTYGIFTITRDDTAGTLVVTYQLNATPHADVAGLVTGAELFEKLTVYVHDGDDPSVPQEFVVTIEGPAANSVPTATGDGTATVANDEAGTIETTISFGDTDSENDDLAIRAVASGGADVPATPMYDSNVPLIVQGTDAMVAGEYGMFTISRSNADDELTVTYDLTEGHDDVTGAGDDLFEKLTVYVHDGDDPSAAQDFVVTINKPSPVQNGFYHLPAMGEIPVVEGATSYSITTSNRAVPGLASDRVTEETSGLFFRVEIEEDAGGGAWTWSAIPTEALRIFNSATDTTDREFWVHAHSGPGDGDNLMEVGQRIEVLFNRVDIIAEANPDVTSSHYRAIPTDGISNAGTGQNELFIGTEPDTVAGTTGDDVFRNTGGGTDVIFARGGDDTFNLGRNHSDVIYHRFSSSGTDWTNTDGGDTISNYVRSGANVANDTFIFVDTDTTDVAIKDDFMGNNNIRFYATLTGTDADLKISQFEIRFVDPDNPDDPAESTITIIYNTDLQPTIGTDQAERTAFGLPDEDTVMAGIQVTAGEKEITNGTTWGHYFGETPDAFQVIDDSELPSAITNIADAVDMI